MFAFRVSCGCDGGDACLAAAWFVARMFLNDPTAGIVIVAVCIWMYACVCALLCPMYVCGFLIGQISILIVPNTKIHILVFDSDSERAREPNIFQL
jgi:hypothetical protein